MIAKREAIRECKRLWKEIGKSGLSKSGFFYSLEGEKWREKNYQDDCPLCEHVANHKKHGCSYCILTTQFGTGCRVLGYADNLPTSFCHTVSQLEE